MEIGTSDIARSSPWVGRKRQARSVSAATDTLTIVDAHATCRAPRLPRSQALYGALGGRGEGQQATFSGYRFGSTRCGRVWRGAAALIVAALASACWLAASAGATVIHVNTSKETAIFDRPGHNECRATTAGSSETAAPKGMLAARGDQGRQHPQRGLWLPGGSGERHDRVEAGVYHILDNFFIEEKMTFLGPNKGVAGNDPKLGDPEAVALVRQQPELGGAGRHVLARPAEDTGDARGAGTVFDGIEMQGRVCA